MPKNKIKAIIECLLFVSTEPLHIEKIADITKCSKEDLLLVLNEIGEDLEQEKRGLQLLETADSFQLATKPEYHEYIEKIYKPNTSHLSRAALETLAIIAYKQPILRTEIENIRGVNCERVMTTLLERGLIEERGRKDAPGKPIFYGTTLKFLSSFGLKKITDLPPIE